jgi:S-adenosylmethionine uptake transporter
MRDLRRSAYLQNTAQTGILFVLVGVFLFSVQDLLVKAISGSYAVHQIVFVRSLVAIVLLLLIVRLEGGLALLQTRRPVLHLVRASAMFVAYTCFYLGLAALSLADTVALFFVAPLFVTALSVPLLGEKVGSRRWIAVSVGFLGVVVMMRPGASALEPASIFPVLAALFYALSAVLTRRLGGTESGSSMAFYATGFYMAASAVVGLTIGTGALSGGEPVAGMHTSWEFLLRSWVLPPWSDLGLMALCGLIAGLGFYFLAQAYRMTNVSTVATFEYIAVPLSVVWGYLFWRELPGPHSILGMLLIVGSGLYVAKRESPRPHRGPTGPGSYPP